MPLETKSLVRAVGRWSLAALMLNTVVGSSVLGYPSLATATFLFGAVQYVVIQYTANCSHGRQAAC